MEAGWKEEGLEDPTMVPAAVPTEELREAPEAVGASGSTSEAAIGYTEWMNDFFLFKITPP